MTHILRHLSSFIFLILVTAFSLLLTGCAKSKNTAPSAIPDAPFSNEARASLKRTTHGTSIRHGKILYDYYCAGCHGDNARGAGPDTEEADAPAPNLISLLETKDSINELECTDEFAKLQYHGQLQTKELIEMASYVRSLP